MVGGAYAVRASTEELLARLESAELELTLTLFVIDPAEFGCTVIKILLDELADIEPSAQVTVPLKLLHPGDPETNATPLGRESVRATIEAGEGPAFETVNVNTRLRPTAAGLGPSL